MSFDACAGAYVPYVCSLSLLAFGFCEYSEPEAAVRALRQLNELRLGEKKLLVRSLFVGGVCQVTGVTGEHVLAGSCRPL